MEQPLSGRLQNVASDTAIIRPLRHSIWRSLRHDSHVTCLVLTSLIIVCLSTLTACCQQSAHHVTATPDNSYFIPRDRFVQPSPSGGERDVTASTTSGGTCRRVYVFTGSAFILVVYMVYMVECCYNSQRLLLNSLTKRCLDPRTAYLLVDSLRHARPVVSWAATSFHYIHRADHVLRLRHGGHVASSATHAQWQRVVTRRAISGFDGSSVGGVCDLSPRLVGLELFPVTCIRFSRHFSFASSRSRREFTAQRDVFLDSCEAVDDNIDFRQTFDLLSATSDYFKSRVVVVRDPDVQPWYLRKLIYWLASALLLSWPLRILIQTQVAHVDYNVHKLFGPTHSQLSDGANYFYRSSDDDVSNNSTSGDESRDNASVSSAGSYSDVTSSVGSSRCVVIPSYSQALLMDCCLNVATSSDKTIKSDVKKVRRVQSCVSFVVSHVTGLSTHAPQSERPAHRHLPTSQSLLTKLLPVGDKHPAAAASGRSRDIGTRETMAVWSKQPATTVTSLADNCTGVTSSYYDSPPPSYETVAMLRREEDNEVERGQELRRREGGRDGGKGRLGDKEIERERKQDNEVLWMTRGPSGTTLRHNGLPT